MPYNEDLEVIEVENRNKICIVNTNVLKYGEVYMVKKYMKLQDDFYVEVKVDKYTYLTKASNFADVDYYIGILEKLKNTI